MSDAAELALTWKRPFSEQVDYFRSKLNLPSERWDDIRGAAHDRGFMVAGVTKADMLQDFRDAVDRAIAKGGGLQAFRRDFAQIVQRYGWDYNGSFDWRSRVIYQTNLASSYAAGRWAQLTDPAFAKAWPYWRYVHADGFKRCAAQQQQGKAAVGHEPRQIQAERQAVVVAVGKPGNQPGQRRQPPARQAKHKQQQIGQPRTCRPGPVMRRRQVGAVRPGVVVRRIARQRHHQKQRAG